MQAAERLRKSTYVPPPALDRDATPNVRRPAAAAASAPLESRPALPEADAPSLPSDEAEAAYLAEARERGDEGVDMAAALAAVEEAEEKSALPPLNDLVEKISPEIRDVLEDLFRAKFVRVTRVRKKDLAV
ncbi:MAG: hypothetical protein HZA31_13120 [Opitutae bacterium]|nr:hypothetical protein [Opitutae bacterium]